MQLLWFTALFFIVWIGTQIMYWNVRKTTFIPVWMIYLSVTLSSVLVLYFVTDIGFKILFIAFVLGVVQGNQEVVAGE